MNNFMNSLYVSPPTRTFVRCAIKSVALRCKCRSSRDTLMEINRVRDQERAGVIGLPPMLLYPFLASPSEGRKHDCTTDSRQWELVGVFPSHGRGGAVGKRSTELGVRVWESPCSIPPPYLFFFPHFISRCHGAPTQSARLRRS